jgi:hypothetical protein
MVKVKADLHKKKNFTNFNPRLSCDIVKVNVPCYLRFVVTVKVTIFWDYGSLLSAKNLQVIKRNLMPESARGRRMKVETKNSSTNIVILLPDDMVSYPRRYYCLCII